MSVHFVLDKEERLPLTVNVWN